jgi:hypothetical protein
MYECGGEVTSKEDRRRDKYDYDYDETANKANTQQNFSLETPLLSAVVSDTVE